MDVFSHGLWGGAAFGRASKRAFLSAVAFSVLPDLLSEGVLLLLVVLRAPGMPAVDAGHPNIGEFPRYAQTFYDCTHSLIVFILVLVVTCIAWKRVYVPLLAWGLHILIDIPTHSINLFPTPFLWPLSDFRLDGIAWNRPVILIPNVVLLTVVYAVWIARRAQRTKSRRGDT